MPFLSLVSEEGFVNSELGGDPNKFSIFWLILIQFFHDENKVLEHLVL
jgi:hypothetical protein